jgi:hypothetical protein
MTGHVGILNVGAGDTKLSFDKNNPAERERAKRIVQDMLRKGYAILVEVGKAEDGEPIYRRAKDFDPETCEYIIAGDPVGEINLHEPVQPPARRPVGRPRRVAADKTNAVSVGRMSGG